MSEESTNLFEKLESAFKDANGYLELKDKVGLSIDEISEMLRLTTNGNAYLYSTIGSLSKYEAKSFIYIAIGSDSDKLKKILLCGYIIEPIKGFPVQVETEDTIDSCDSPERLKEFLVELIAQPEITTKILRMINEMDDIPF